MKKKWRRLFVCTALVALIFTGSAVPAFAAGDVAGAIEQTWNTAKGQIQTVVNNVVFPVVDMILAILFFVGDIFSGIGDAIGGVFDFLGEQISNVIWNTMLKWMYETIYNAVADFFSMMGNMGADIFDLDWIQATIKLFTLFGWALFVAGVVVAIFDVAIEYQCGRANIKSTAVNILKGFFACSLIGIVPVELYKFCISLQNIFSHDLSALFAGGRTLDLAGESTSVLQGSFAVANNISFNLFNILAMIAFAYCVIKIFFANIKRGGILLIQMAVGAVYVLCAERLSGRIQSVDETDCGLVSNGVHADNAAVLRAADLPRQYAARTWHHACRQRSAEDCPAIRAGFER